MSMRALVDRARAHVAEDRLDVHVRQVAVVRHGEGGHAEGACGCGLTERTAYLLKPFAVRNSHARSIHV